MGCSSSLSLPSLASFVSSSCFLVRRIELRSLTSLSSSLRIWVSVIHFIATFRNWSLSRECLTNAYIREGSNSCWEGLIRGFLSTYIILSRGSFQVGVERLDVFPVSFGIYSCYYEPTDVKYGLDKFRIVPQGLCNTQMLSRLFSRLRHGWALAR
jgi:hypothetical protein